MSWIQVFFGSPYTLSGFKKKKKQQKNKQALVNFRPVFKISREIGYIVDKYWWWVEDVFLSELQEISYSNSILKYSLFKSEVSYSK